MFEEEREEIVELLREELRGFIAWTMEELGGEYYLENPDQPVATWDETARERVSWRLESDSERAEVWERDRYAFFDHPQHPSIYKVMESEDVELVHYLEEFYCDHYRVGEVIEGLSEEEVQDNQRFEESFGVLVASQAKGWMYRLDFCEVCGLIEIWSMKYNPEEVARHSSAV